MPDSTPAIPCSLAVLSRPHARHEWEPQPGMPPSAAPELTTPGVPGTRRRSTRPDPSP